MNLVVLMGRLTRDPDMRSTNNGEGSMARYTLAVDRIGQKDAGQTADFINCIVFGRGAEFAEKYLRQGIKIIVTGRIQSGSYTNKEGQKIYTTDVFVERQEFAESKAASEGKQENPNPAPVAQPAPEPAPAQPAAEGFAPVPDGNPFDAPLPATEDNLPWMQ